MNESHSDNTGKKVNKAYVSSITYKAECPYCHKINVYKAVPIGVKVTHRCVHCGAKR